MFWRRCCGLYARLSRAKRRSPGSWWRLRAWYAQDVFGVSSFIRALSLAPVYYPALLHFFHSTAWNAQGLYRQWEGWLIGQPVVERVEGRFVILGDHTKQPKDGRRMPQVATMHQDSETSSKPSFFRGHHWGCLSLLGQVAAKRFALPLWAEIHPEDSPDKRTTRLVHVAAAIGLRLQEKMFLVLDAFFSVGPVFRAAAESNGRMHILTRAKKNIVAYRLPPPTRAHRRGRRRVYGQKLKLMNLFDLRPGDFLSAKALVYQQQETVRYLVLDLIWKPAKGLVRFILIETSRGRLILMSSDLTLGALQALSLYTARVRIESLFASVKNLLGGLAYHFWSKYLAPASRRPTRGTHPAPVSSRPDRTANTWPPSRNSWPCISSCWARFNSWPPPAPMPSGNTPAVGCALPAAACPPISSAAPP